MKTRYREPAAEMIAFGELPDSILEGVAGGVCPCEDEGAGAANVCKSNMKMRNQVDEIEFDDFSGAALNPMACC